MRIFRGLAGIGALLSLIGAYGAWQDANFLSLAISIASAFLFLAFIVITNDFIEKDKIFEAAKRYGRGEISADQFAGETKEILES